MSIRYLEMIMELRLLNEVMKAIRLILLVAKLHLRATLTVNRLFNGFLGLPLILGTKILLKERI